MKSLLVTKLKTPCVIERRIPGDEEDKWKRVARAFASIEPVWRGRIINEDQQGFSSSMFDGLVRSGTNIEPGDRLLTNKGTYFVEAIRPVDSDRSVIPLNLVKKDA